MKRNDARRNKQCKEEEMDEGKKKIYIYKSKMD